MTRGECTTEGTHPMTMTQQATIPDSTPDALAVYMRVSSEEQKQQGTIQNQRAAADRYLAVQDITPYGWYADDGVSGTVPFASRPEGARLLADAAAGRVRTVLVWRLDRMGRNALSVLQAVETLERAGVRIVSITESFDTSTPAGRLQLNMLATIAQFERDSIIQRTDEGNARRLERSAWMGGRANIGYRVEGKDAQARLVLNDTIDAGSGYSEVDVVRLGWHLLVSGVVYTYPVPALLTTEQVAQARAALARHRHDEQPRGPANATAHAYLLRGLLRCAQCGQRYTTTWTRPHVERPEGGKQWRYYVCSTRHYHHHITRGARRAIAIVAAAPQDCDAPGVDAERYEQAIWADIEQFIRQPGEVLALLAAEWHATTEQQEASRAQLAELQRTLDGLQGERDAVLTQYRKGRISERDLGRQLDSIADEEQGQVRARERLVAALQDASEAARPG